MFCFRICRLVRHRRFLLLLLVLSSLTLVILTYLYLNASLPTKIIALGELQNIDAVNSVTVSTQSSNEDISKLLTSFDYKLPLADSSFCSRRLISYGKEFARLRGVIIDYKHFASKRRGGETIKAVINQAESLEYYTVSSGGFRLDDCTSNSGGNKLVSDSSISITSFSFAGANNHLNNWKFGLLITEKGQTSVRQHKPASQQKEFTVAIQRYEYVNLYHTMTDWYNAFLVSRVYFNQADLARDVNILWIDSHPAGSLDSVWSVLFKSAYRLADLGPGETYFDDLVWGWQGYRSPLYVRDPISAPPPLLSEFREYFLSAYNVQSRIRVSNCFGANEPSVLFIWRHNYVAHPRNPTGNVMRKISNENELLGHIQKTFPSMHVRGVQIDNYTMAEQLQMIADTDILIGKAKLQAFDVVLIHFILLEKRCDGR